MRKVMAAVAKPSVPLMTGEYCPVRRSASGLMSIPSASTRFAPASRNEVVNACVVASTTKTKAIKSAMPIAMTARGPSAPLATLAGTNHSMI
jgi:hypothetical protein